jgi:hypothetical protein
VEEVPVHAIARWRLRPADLVTGFWAPTGVHMGCPGTRSGARADRRGGRRGRRGSTGHLPPGPPFLAYSSGDAPYLLRAAGPRESQCGPCRSSTGSVARRAVGRRARRDACGWPRSCSPSRGTCSAAFTPRFTGDLKK